MRQRRSTFCDFRKHNVQASVIVPFHRNLGQLRASLAAIRSSAPRVELIVAADGAVDDCRPTAEEFGARIVVVAGPSGPATARNRAAAVATGDVLFFVDTDVVVAADTIHGMSRVLESELDIAGVFGSYDHNPPAPNFISQFKNLSHAYVHEVATPEARTFWAGLGAVRATVFRAVGGFDERFARPSVEDIDLGYRITGAGHRLRLDPRFRATHLKRWTLANCIVTDVMARGVPWTQLIHRYHALSNDLNTSWPLRISVVIAYLTLGVLVAGVAAPPTLAAVPLLAGLLVALNSDYYRWLYRRRGLMFALAVVPVHWIHHLCNGVSFVAGTLLYQAARRGIRLPGALPAGPWREATPSAEPERRHLRTP